MVRPVVIWAILLAVVGRGILGADVSSIQLVGEAVRRRAGGAQLSRGSDMLSNC